MAEGRQGMPEARVLSPDDFAAFCLPLIGKSVARLWRGYGSALFLECGSLSDGRVRRDGSRGNPVGEFTVMVEWSWRIEGKRRIICGSWSDEDRWLRGFRFVEGQSIRTISLVGRLAELDIEFGNGAHLVSFVTSEGDPEWGIIRHTESGVREVGFRSGRLLLKGRPKRA